MKQSQVVLLVAAVTALQPVARLQRAPVRMAASDILASDRILIAPALATSNVAKLGEEAQAAVAAGADCLHFNVMDGQNTVWKSTSASGAPENSSLSRFSATTRPSWLGRAVRNSHRRAVEQASRRWRGGRRDDSARTRRKF